MAGVLHKGSTMYSTTFKLIPRSSDKLRSYGDLREKVVAYVGRYVVMLDAQLYTSGPVQGVIFFESRGFAETDLCALADVAEQCGWELRLGERSWV